MNKFSKILTLLSAFITFHAFSMQNRVGPLAAKLAKAPAHSRLVAKQPLRLMTTAPRNAQLIIQRDKRYNYNYNQQFNYFPKYPLLPILGAATALGLGL